MILLINLTGLLLVLCGLTDMLLTILHYEGYGFFSRLVQRSIWRTIKALTSLFPAKSRVYLRSMGAPLMIIGNLAFWLGIQLVGFTFFYWAGMGKQQFCFFRSAAPGGVYRCPLFQQRYSSHSGLWRYRSAFSSLQIYGYYRGASGLFDSDALHYVCSGHTE